MTNRPTPITDEDLSADLDGEATPELRARIASDPGASARQGALADAGHYLADAPVTPLDAATVDALIARAMDEGSVAEAPPATSRLSLRRPPAWLVAAVVALVVALGVGLVLTGRDDGTTREQATATGSARADTAESANSGGTSEPGAGGANDEDGASKAAPPSLDHGAGLAPGAPVPTDAYAAQPAFDLGSFPTPDALRTSLADAFPDTSVAAANGAEQAPTVQARQRCGQQVALALDLDGDPLHQGYATVEGRPVLVYEFASTSYVDQQPTTLVAAVGAESCDPVVTFQR